LRRTVIKGLPSDFIPHNYGGGENAKEGEINIRAQVWRNVIDLDKYKQKCINKFNLENLDQIESAEELYNYYKHKRSLIP
jgi:hypothetical protein